MSQDPENGKNEPAPVQGGDQAEASAPKPSGNDPSGIKMAGAVSHLLANQQALLERLFLESGGEAWGLTAATFESALEASARKHFSNSEPTLQKLEEYLGALHLHDLALACGCAQGHAAAWEHLVVTYRGYLRAAAGAIQRCSATAAAACDLADSLFADLYGLSGGKRADRSLFRYFHGRSSLKTWLRAILAQRHVDAIRANRRFTELDGDEQGLRVATPAATQDPRMESLQDPHRSRYVTLFARVLETALALLNPRDRDRLRLYYAEERTLAEIGRALGEHESSVSRNLERIRRGLRSTVEQSLRQGRFPENGSFVEPAFSDEEISLCFEYASEDAPIDFAKLFPGSRKLPPKPERPKS
jgi:RNA polymerase sigma-70 factor